MPNSSLIPETKGGCANPYSPCFGEFVPRGAKRFAALAGTRRNSRPRNFSSHQIHCPTPAGGSLALHARPRPEILGDLAKLTVFLIPSLAQSCYHGRSTVMG